MDCLSTGADACRTRSIEHCQVDTLCDVLTGSERCVRTLSSSRGRTSPPQHGVAPRHLGRALCLAWHCRRGWLWISLIPRSRRGKEINSKSRPSARPYSLQEAGGRAAGPGGRPQGLVPTPGEGPPDTARTAPELGIRGATRESYGMAVTVRASRSLFSLRRCVSNRSPTLNDVMFTKDRPVRL